MDTDRFEHIVNENKEMRDTYISELISHTMSLQKQVIKINRPGLFYKFWDGFLNAASSSTAGNVPWPAICHFFVIPLLLIIVGWSSYGVFRCVIDDVRETATGKWWQDPPPVPNYTPLSFILSEDGEKCHTIITRLEGGSYEESACIEDPFDALMIIRDLQHTKLQAQNVDSTGIENAYTSVSREEPTNTTFPEDLK